MLVNIYQFHAIEQKRFRKQLNIFLTDLGLRSRQGITPEDHARRNAAAVKVARERNKARKQERHAEGHTQLDNRRSSARSTASSSGYGTSRYTPRCFMTYPGVCQISPSPLQGACQAYVSCIERSSAESAGALRLHQAIAEEVRPSLY